MTPNIHAAHGAAALGEYDPEKRPADDMEQNAAWAQLLAQAVVHRLPVPVLDAPVAFGEAQSSAPVETPAPEGSPESLARTGSGAAGVGSEGSAALERIATEVDVGGLGKVAISVTREAGGLSIVIGVADSHVKALIESDRAALMQALKTSGLSVARVEVWGSEVPGTTLAPNARGSRSMNSRAQNPRVRAYRTSADEEAMDTAQNVDVTA